MLLGDFLCCVIWLIVGLGPTVLAAGAGRWGLLAVGAGRWGLFGHISLVYHISFLFPSLLEDSSI